MRDLSQAQSPAFITRLENYTLKYPQEVLLVHAQIEDEDDQIIVFKGFSSSLMRPTASDPAVLTLADNAIVHQIDRIKGPYQPQAIQYLEQGLTQAAFMAKLAALNL